MIEWLSAFVILFITDICWASYVSKTKDGSALTAALWSVALFVTGGLAVIGYTRDPWLLIPSCVGAFAGTYLGVVLNQKKGPQ